jgi:hypothetical protein
VPADLSTADGSSTAAAAALDSLGGVDILVNNVGSGAVHTFDQLTDEDWQRTFDLNFFSYLRITRACLPTLRESDAGSIINNASDLARQPEAVPIDYSAARRRCWRSPRAWPARKGPACESTPLPRARCGPRSGPSRAASPTPSPPTTTWNRWPPSSTR